ncbi:DUF443 family protein [Staphylococcus pettenkoferi]
MPMLNWVIPIKYTELTYEELNSLYVIKNRYNSAYSLAIAGAGLLITRHIKKITYLMDMYLPTIWMFGIYLIGFISIVALRVYISRRLKITKFENKEKQKLILFPTFKNLIIVLFGFFLFSLLSSMPYYMISENIFNIIFYICWLGIFLVFIVLNMCTITGKKIHVKICRRKDQ